MAQLDFSRFYARFSSCGGQPYAPEILFALLLYGYCTGVFSGRRIEGASYESLPFRFIAGDWHPDHDTMADFRRSSLAEIKELLVEVLLLAQEFGVLKLGNLSLDGSKVHADASKSKAVSYKRLLELEVTIKREVEELFHLAEVVEQAELPEGFRVDDESTFRQVRLERLAQAEAALEAGAEERYQAEVAAYQEKLRGGEAEESGRKTREGVRHSPLKGGRARRTSITSPTRSRGL